MLNNYVGYYRPTSVLHTYASMKCTYIYVTGFAKTNHNVTLAIGQLHFIDPANSYTTHVLLY